MVRRSPSIPLASLLTLIIGTHNSEAWTSVSWTGTTSPWQSRYGPRTTFQQTSILPCISIRTCTTRLSVHQSVDLESVAGQSQEFEFILPEQEPTITNSVSINNEGVATMDVGTEAKIQANTETVLNGLLLALCFGYAAFTIFNIDHGMTRGWTQSEIAMRIPLDNWNTYETALAEKPVYTKTLINVVIYLLGDWLSQTLFQGKNALDFDAMRYVAAVVAALLLLLLLLSLKKDIYKYVFLAHSLSFFWLRL